jgi:hypothetical protein
MELQMLYGPNDTKALDFELNAHVRATREGRIVGYLTRNDGGKTPRTAGP